MAIHGYIWFATLGPIQHRQGINYQVMVGIT